MKLQKFEDLLTAFEQIPKTEVSPPTFMEVAGYSHYEDVCSNILAFFFDTEERHGFGDLFLQALCSCLGIEEEQSKFTTQDVSREVGTATGKRIDLWIETDETLFVIENKIHHWLANPLEEYSAHAEAHRGEREVHKIVLALHHLEVRDGFKSITHQQFLEEVLSRLGSYVIGKDSKYLTYLLDFSETILNHTKKTPMNLQMLDFLTKEEENINQLIDEKNKVYGAIINKLKQVKGLVDADEHKQWIYSKLCLVHDVQLNDKTVIAVDTWFTVKGIETTIFVRSKHSDKATLLKSLSVYSDKYELRADGRIVYRAYEEMSIMSSNEDVAAMLTELLPQLKLKESTETVV